MNFVSDGGIVKHQINTNMEQFSLEKYLANPARRVVTRDGRKARIICTDMRCANYPIVALITICDNNTENIYTYTKDGEWDNYESTDYDLFFATEKDKEQRFNPKTLKPYEKVLVKYSLDCDFDWECDLFSHIDNKDDEFPYHCVGANYRYCIPYNDGTKHLAGTDEKAPEYYRYWEE